MTPRQIDQFCASLPAATRTVQWEGVIVFKVGGKMFCLIAPREHSVGRICFKCPDEHYEALSRSDGFRPAPYLARAKWVALDDPGVLTTAEMKAYIERAHAVIAAALPKKKAGGAGSLRPARPGCGSSRALIQAAAGLDPLQRTRPHSIHPQRAASPVNP